MSKVGNIITAFAVGIGAGTVIGILYAPRAGKHTRDQLSYRFSKGLDKLNEAIDDLWQSKDELPNEAKAEAEKIINQANEQANRFRQDIESLMAKIKENNN